MSQSSTDLSYVAYKAKELEAFLDVTKLMVSLLSNDILDIDLPGEDLVVIANALEDKIDSLNGSVPQFLLAKSDLFRLSMPSKEDLFEDHDAEEPSVVNIEGLRKAIESLMESLGKSNKIAEEELVAFKASLADPYASVDAAEEEVGVGEGGYDFPEVGKTSSPKMSLPSDKTKLDLSAEELEKLRVLEVKLAAIPAPEADLVEEGVEVDEVQSWQDVLKEVVEKCDSLERDASRVKRPEERREELREVFSQLSSVSGLLEKERAALINQMRADLAELTANPSLVGAVAKMNEIEESLKNCLSMPSIDAFKARLAVVGKLMIEAEYLKKDRVYQGCYSSIIAGFKAASSPFTEFALGEEAQDVAPTQEEVVSRDSKVHDEVETFRQAVEYAIYGQNLREEIAALPDYKKGADNVVRLGVYNERLDSALHGFVDSQKRVIGAVRGARADDISHRVEGVVETISKLRAQGKEELEASLQQLDKEIAEVSERNSIVKMNLEDARREERGFVVNLGKLVRDEEEFLAKQREKVGALESKLQDSLAAISEGFAKSSQEVDAVIAVKRSEMVTNQADLNKKQGTKKSFFGNIWYSIRKGRGTLDKEIKGLETAAETIGLSIKTSEDKKVELAQKLSDEQAALKAQFEKEKAQILLEKSGKLTVAEATAKINSIGEEVSALEAQVAALTINQEYLEHAKRISEVLPSIKNIEAILARESTVPEVAAASSYQVSEAEQSSLATLGEVGAFNSELMAREDVAEASTKKEDIDIRRKNFEALMAGMIQAGFTRAKSGEEPGKNTKREVLGVLSSMIRTAGDSLGPVGSVAGRVVGLGSLALDKVFLQWQKTANANVGRAIDAIGPDAVEIAIKAVTKRIADLYANQGSDFDPEASDVALGLFKKEATVHGLAVEVALSLVQAIGDEEVSLAGRRPSADQFETNENGEKVIKAGTPFDSYIDDLVSSSLERASFSQKFKYAQKATMGRATTEETVRGNITAKGAKNNVGLIFPPDETGHRPRLVPTKKDADGNLDQGTPRYGFRLATKKEIAIYRAKGELEGYSSHQDLQTRFAVESDKLADLIPMLPSGESLSEESLSDMVKFLAAHKAVLSKSASANALRSFVSTALEPASQRFELSDAAIAGIDRLANLYNEANNIAVKKGVLSSKVDGLQLCSVVIGRALQNRRILSEINHEDPVTGMVVVVGEPGKPPLISSAFRGNVLEPQKALIGQLKLAITQDLDNKYFNLINNPDGKAAMEIVEDLLTVIQRTSNDRKIPIEQKLKSTGLFNLDSPFNIAKFQSIVSLAKSLTATHVEFERDHTADEALLYNKYNSSQRQYDEKEAKLLKAIFGDDLSAVSEDQKIDIKRIIALYEKTMEDSRKPHGDKALQGIFVKEMAEFYDRFSITPKAGEEAVVVEDAFKKAVDAHNLVLGRNVVKVSVAGKITDAIKSFVTTAKSGARTQKAFLSLADRFRGKDLWTLRSDLKPEETQAESATKLESLLLDHTEGRSSDSSLFNEGTIAYGTKAEKSRDCTVKLVDIAQKYADGLIGEASGTDEQVAKALADKVSAKAIKKFLIGNPEFQAIFNFNKGGDVLEGERTAIISIFANLVKSHLSPEREAGYVMASKMAQKFSQDQFDAKAPSLAIRMGAVDDQDQESLKNIIQDYVVAIEGGGDVRKYKNMLFNRIKDLIPGFAVGAKDQDCSNGIIHSEEVSSYIRACKITPAMRAIDYSNIEKLEARLSDALPAADLDKIDILKAKAATPEFSEATLAEKKKILSAFLPKGETVRSRDILKPSELGKVVGWSEQRLKFDAVLDAMINLSSGYEMQRPAVEASASAASGVVAEVSVSESVATAPVVAAPVSEPVVTPAVTAPEAPEVSTPLAPSSVVAGESLAPEVKDVSFAEALENLYALAGKCSVAESGKELSEYSEEEFTKIITRAINHKASQLESGVLDNDAGLKKILSPLINAGNDRATKNLIKELEGVAKSFSEDKVLFDNLPENDFYALKGGGDGERFQKASAATPSSAKFSLAHLQSLHDLLSDPIKPNDEQVKYLISEVGGAALNVGVSADMRSFRTELVMGDAFGHPTLASLATKNGHLAALEGLIAAGARKIDPEAVMDAVKAGHSEVLGFLIEKGVAMPLQVKGEPLLHFVCKSRNVDLLKAVIKSPEVVASVNNVDKDGETAVYFARIPEMRDVLEAAGAVVPKNDRKTESRIEALKAEIAAFRADKFKSGKETGDLFSAMDKLIGHILDDSVGKAPDEIREFAKSVLKPVIKMGVAVSAFGRRGAILGRDNFDKLLENAKEVATLCREEGKEFKGIYRPLVKIPAPDVGGDKSAEHVETRKVFARHETTSHAAQVRAEHHDSSAVATH